MDQIYILGTVINRRRERIDVELVERFNRRSQLNEISADVRSVIRTKNV